MHIEDVLNESIHCSFSYYYYSYINIYATNSLEVILNESVKNVAQLFTVDAHEVFIVSS